jgi:predicted HAD superfamily Cof-like phosphohydrolase
MKDAYRMVADFHRAFGVDAPDAMTSPSADVVKLRWELMTEELAEYAVAVASHDDVGIADALADLAYVVIGTAVAHGLTRFDEIFSAVHISNMSKLGPDGKPIYRPDGKVLKGDNYSPPNLAPLLQTNDRSNQCP